MGLPASGKSYVGKQLANKLAMPFIDLDEAIEAHTGQSISAIFSTHGEVYFRTLEAELVRTLTNTTPTFVMACGGGTPCYHNTLNFLKQNGLVIYLATPLATIIENLKNDTTQRPLLTNQNPIEVLQNLLVQRQAFYAQAHLTVNSSKGLVSLLQSVDG